MKRAIFVLFAVGVSAVQAEVLDRPGGLKIGQRMTLRPYVSLDYTYDSNNDQQKDGTAVSSWAVNPGLNLTYNAETWNLTAGVFYRYLAYNKYVRSLNENNYGENVTFNWSSSQGGTKGWSLMLTERYQKICEDDDLTRNNGYGLWRDRQEFNVGAVLQRRFNDRFHGDINASYYYLDYDNDPRRYAALYGWDRWTVGVEAGYAMSKWMDLLVAGSYQGYTQDNGNDLTGYGKSRYSDDSKGWTVHGGFGSYFTERISYRVMTGWSQFEYSDGADDINGWTYSVSGNWKMSDTWNMMLLATSYYQPSEREYGCANRVDSISWGIGHSMIRGKLRAKFDIAYRRETREYSSQGTWDYDEDILSTRFGLDYTINRFLAVYGRLEYQGCWFSDDVGYYDRDYNRLRGTIGFRLTY
ncbi:MAG: outer membrane beta-barrel protein [Kiritimatiellae bacterium]|nr:outer membrane beta-barrel protein [Kiritimatiellia bacterium]